MDNWRWYIDTVERYSTINKTEQHRWISNALSKRSQTQDAPSCMILEKTTIGTSLVVQRVRLGAPNAGGLGSIPGQGTGSHMHAATKKPECCN